ncbi:MAG: hypothetical protein WBP45_05695, partial [Daejeonella sp.]
MSIPEHSKIINKIARQFFLPYGIERRGQSRIWLDDPGWFTTVIEFQPGWDRGTYLNVAVNFHWYLNDHFSFDIGNRENQFVKFDNENQFIHEVEHLCKIAIGKVLEYKTNLINVNSALNIITNYEFSSDSLWGNYHKGTICGLAGDINRLKKYYDLLLSVDHNVPWAIELKQR